MWFIATNNPAPQMDLLMLLGFVSALMTLLIWGYGGRSKRGRIALAVCLAGLALYGFLQGAWPLGLVLTVAAMAVIARLGMQLGATGIGETVFEHRHSQLASSSRDDRMTRMFGSSESIN